MVFDWILETILGSWLIGWVWLPVSICVFVLSVRGLKGHSVFTRVFASLFFATAGLLMCVFTPLAWVFRDGLGPDAIRSYGWEALQGFGVLWLPLLFVSGLFVGFGWLLCYGHWSIRVK